jgi:hypothetical protein
MRGLYAMWWLARRKIPERKIPDAEDAKVTQRTQKKDKKK